MTTLYTTYRSRGTRNIWLAHELGLALDIVQVVQAYRLADPDAPDAVMNTRSPAFLALSPAGAIPVLKDGDLVLSESLAINLYLAQKHGGPLAPADAAEQAQMVQWALYGMTSLEPGTLAAMYVYTQNRAATPEGRAELERLTQELLRPLAALEAHLVATGGHMVGGRFTVADINMAEIVRYAQAHAPMLQPFPAILSWLAAAQARPAFAAMMAAREAEPLTF